MSPQTNLSIAQCVVVVRNDMKCQKMPNWFHEKSRNLSIAGAMTQ